MKKLTKALVGGLAFISCAGLLAGCGNNVNSQMSNLNGSYMYSEANSPVMQKQKLTSKQKSEAPRLLYHFKGNKIYAQNIQPDLKPLMKKQVKILNAQVNKRISKLPAKKQAQAKMMMSQRIGALVESERERPKAHETFFIKSVKKQGNIYKVHGYNKAYTKQLDNKGKLKNVTRKGKALTLRFMKTSKGVKILPKGITKKMIKKDPTFNKVSSNSATSELKRGNSSSAQAGY